ncbi:unnamed protein product [Cladocopium goreaui]|uniref:Uncharacterized protein n=1 Tax=Cladocopium goreaui TaxID=2562237 RepID=A0A9P1CY54_9DINO|nr:unnamed protein product [Cladocopium goreaui]
MAGASVANRSDTSSARNETMNSSVHGPGPTANETKNRDSVALGDTRGLVDPVDVDPGQGTTAEPTQTFWAAFVGFDTTELQPMARRAGRAERFLPRSAAVQL